MKHDQGRNQEDHRCLVVKILGVGGGGVGVGGGGGGVGGGGRERFSIQINFYMYLCKERNCKTEHGVILLYQKNKLTH